MWKVGRLYPVRGYRLNRFRLFGAHCATSSPNVPRFDNYYINTHITYRLCRDPAACPNTIKASTDKTEGGFIVKKQV